MEDINQNAQMADVSVSTVETVQATEVQDDTITWREGINVSITGMAIVFFGLVLTFCYISSLPLLAGGKKKDKPAKEETKAQKVTPGAKEGEMEPGLQAAIAYVIAAEAEYERMTDYTKITIRRDENQQVWGVAGKMRTLAARKISKM